MMYGIAEMNIHVVGRNPKQPPKRPDVFLDKRRK